MSGFENYSHEMNELDDEIIHYAASCSVNLAGRCPQLPARLQDRRSNLAAGGYVGGACSCRPTSPSSLAGDVWAINDWQDINHC